MSKKILYVALLIAITVAMAQPMTLHKADSLSKKAPTLYRYAMQYSGGLFLADPTDGLSGVRIIDYSGIDLRITKESYGQKKWHQLFLYPDYGLGLHQGFYYLPDTKPGYPTAIYGFFNAPFKKRKNWESRYEITLGLSFGFLGHNPPSHSDNAYYGSTENVRISLAYENRFYVSPRLKGSLGLSFIHYSNGYTHFPNPGMNTINLTLGFIYGHKEMTYTKTALASSSSFQLIDNPLPTFKSVWEFYTVISGGTKTINRDAQNKKVYYPVFSVSADLCRHYSYKGKFTLGGDLFYDGTLVTYYKDDYQNGVPNKLMWYYGLHIGHEWMIQRFTIVTQFGWMLKDVKQRDRCYGRVAFRYDISQNFFARVGLKLPSVIEADFLEWGLGFNLYK